VAIHSRKAKDLPLGPTYASEHQPLVGRKKAPRNTRMLEPLTEVKSNAAMRNTDSSFMPSPKKLPSQKLIPLQDREDVKFSTGEICKCESPKITFNK
jgi:hypothetical protein